MPDVCDGILAMQYTDVDLAAEGGYLKPLQKEFTVMPTGPNLVIELKPKVQHPILNGIEIYSREMDGEGAVSRLTAAGPRQFQALGHMAAGLLSSLCDMRATLPEMFLIGVASHIPTVQAMWPTRLPGAGQSQPGVLVVAANVCPADFCWICREANSGDPPGRTRDSQGGRCR